MTAPLAPAPIAPPNVTPGTSISTINDPVTGNSYSRDTSVAGSTYQLVPKTTTPATPAAPVTPAGGSSAPDSSTSAQDQVAISLGYPSYAAALSSLTAAPSESDTQLYNDAYSAAGLDDLNNTILSKQDDLTSAQNNIDDNPWLDESDRVGRAKTVTDLGNADIKNLQDQYSTSLKSVEDLVTRESDDQNATTASNKAKLAALEAQAKTATTAQTAAAKTAATPPKTVKGSTSGTTYAWNAGTQTFTPIIPATPKAPATKVSTADAVSSMSSELQAKVGSTNADGTQYSKDGYISPADWDTALQAWNAQGLSSASFISNFKQYANVADPSNNYAGLTK